MKELFKGDETETIDYVQQQTHYLNNKKNKENRLTDIKSQQDNIDRYRSQTQETINSANAEIKRLQEHLVMQMKLLQRQQNTVADR